MEKIGEPFENAMTAGHWQLFAHSSDTGVRGVGATLSEAFQAVGKALTSMVTDIELVEPKEEVKIVCSAPDISFLLVDWLNAIIFEMSSKNMLFRQFNIIMIDHTLEATLKGEKVNREKHAPAVEPKGATFTELKVKKMPNGLWLAQCVIDV